MRLSLRNGPGGKVYRHHLLAACPFPLRDDRISILFSVFAPSEARLTPYGYASQRGAIEIALRSTPDHIIVTNGSPGAHIPRVLTAFAFSAHAFNT